MKEAREVRLIDGAQHGAADRGIAEQRLKVVHAQQGDLPGRVLHLHLDRAVPAQQKQQVGAGVVPPTHLVALQRRRSGGRIGHGGPLDTIEVHDLRTRRAIRRPADQRDVADEPLADGAAPATRSSVLNRNGPLPTISMTCVAGSVRTRRSGIMAGMYTPDFASASGSSGKGRFSRNTMRRSSGAVSSSAAADSAWP